MRIAYSWADLAKPESHLLKGQNYQSTCPPPQDSGQVGRLSQGFINMPSPTACDAYEERAAIAEYDGHLSRADAEKLALLEKEKLR